MNSEAIYAILASKAHDVKYLDLYFRYIKRCIRENYKKTKEELGYTEKHHICPKGKALFPEYKSKRKFKWNIVVLTVKQHIAAHYFISKTYGGSQISAYHLLILRNSSFVSADKLNTISEMQSKFATDMNNDRVINGTHPWAGEENGKKHRAHMLELSSRGEHYWQTPEYRLAKSNIQLEKLRLGTHVSQDPIAQEKIFKWNMDALATGTHPFQRESSKENTSARLLETSSNGTHNFQKHKNRENVAELRSLRTELGVTLCVGWNNKPDAWVNDKISELKSIKESR